jgi:hypothetical protein
MENDWHGRRWELLSAKTKAYKRKGPDTRRRNAAGKLIGDHTSRRFKDASFIRRWWARSERRRARYELLGDFHMRGAAHWRSEYDYKGL